MRGHRIKLKNMFLLSPSESQKATKKSHDIVLFVPLLDHSRMFTYPFSIRTAVFVVLLRHGGYFGKKETPFAAAMSPAEAFIGRIAFHLQVKTIFNFSVVRHYSQKKACMAYTVVQCCKRLFRPVRRLLGEKLSNFNFLRRMLRKQ